MGPRPFTVQRLAEHPNVERLVEEDSAHQLNRRAIETEPAAHGCGEACKCVRPFLKDLAGFGFVFEEQRREARQVVLLRGLRPTRKVPKSIEAQGAKNVTCQGGDKPASIEVEEHAPQGANCEVVASTAVA
jgi:hypothetical protein